ncbi:RDD family protein [Rhizobium sp. KVB221]|uniref:RDD family protein n=1 Tax=Rhizobium setariae TaxID=2801340 RepID=A0A936YJA6_9HYPH|nr:RDD family protein [Rhizobium setariae]MBL0371305.1 RDD family protein [Rhizobium setariae]
MADAFRNERNFTADLFDGLLSRRVIAFLIDYTIVLLLMFPAAVLLFVFSILTLGLGFYLYPVLFFLMAGLYFSLSLSSSASATPGMRVMDLMMTTESGQGPDFLTALLHLVVFWILNSVLTPFILLVGLFTDRKRLLHDIALGTTTVRTSRWYEMN